MLFAGGIPLITAAAASPPLPAAISIYENADSHVGVDVSDNGNDFLYAAPGVSSTTSCYSYCAPLRVYSRSAETVQVLEDASGYALNTSTSVSPAISGNGRFVAYQVEANGDTHAPTAFAARFDRNTGAEAAITVTPAGAPIYDASTLSISDDGSRVAFDSYVYNSGTSTSLLIRSLVQQHVHDVVRLEPVADRLTVAKSCAAHQSRLHRHA